MKSFKMTPVHRHLDTMIERRELKGQKLDGYDHRETLEQRLETGEIETNPDPLAPVLERIEKELNRKRKLQLVKQIAINLIKDVPYLNLSKNSKTTINQNKNTMLSTLLSLAKRIIKPRKLLGKLLGSVGSAITIPTIGSAIGFDVEVIATATVVFVAGYFFSWSWAQMKEIIITLNNLSDKVEKKKAK